MVSLFLSSILGGFLGAWMVYNLGKRQNRLTLTLQLLEETEDLIEKIEKSYYILKYQLSEKGKVYIPGQEGTQNSIDVARKIQKESKKLNDIIIAVGDFLDKTAMLYILGKLNRSIYKKTNAYNIIRDFTNLVKEKKFKIAKYNIKSIQEKDDYFYVNWEVGWHYLSELSLNKKINFRTFFELFF